MNKTLLVALSLCAVALMGPAKADWTCGDIGFGQLDTCTGDTNADNPYAGCDGDWRDLQVEGVYVQHCDDGAQHVWVCPMDNFAYDVDGDSCVPVTA